MRSLVLLNFFKFLPLDAEHVDNCPHGDDPGLVVVTASEHRDLHWCYVGRADHSLRELVKSIVENPGPLRDVPGQRCPLCNDGRARSRRSRSRRVVPGTGACALPQAGDLCRVRLGLTASSSSTGTQSVDQSTPRHSIDSGRR
jgi:hypothetical protein